MRRSTPIPVRRGSWLQRAAVSLWLLSAGGAWAQDKTEQTESAPAAETPPAPAPSAPSAVVTHLTSEGFSISAQDKSFEFKIRGYVQADGRFFLSDTDRPGTSSFLLRRARPLFEATLFNAFDFRLLADFGGGTASIQDAYLDIHPWRALQLRAGKFRPPVGLERLQAESSILFIERALPTNMVPNRDVGLQLHGELMEGGLTYAVGVFNGVPDGSSADTNADNSFELAGRVFTYPLQLASLRTLQKLGLGFAMSHGRRLGTTAVPELSPYVGTSQQPFFSYLTGSAAEDTVIAQGQTLRLSPQGTWFWGPAGLLVEYVSSSQEVKRGTERAWLRHQSWQVTGTYVLFDGNASYAGVRPFHPLTPSKGGQGAVDLVARYAALYVDPDTFPTYADPTKAARKAKSWGLGANWYLNTNIRIALNFDHTTFEGGAAGGNRTPESLLLSRFQVSW